MAKSWESEWPEPENLFLRVTASSKALRGTGAQSGYWGIESLVTRRKRTWEWPEHENRSVFELATSYSSNFPFAKWKAAAPLWEARTTWFFSQPIPRHSPMIKFYFYCYLLSRCFLVQQEYISIIFTEYISQTWTHSPSSGQNNGRIISSFRIRYLQGKKSALRSVLRGPLGSAINFNPTRKNTQFSQDYIGQYWNNSQEILTTTRKCHSAI
jgi:hypothetical protein